MRVISSKIKKKPWRKIPGCFIRKISQGAYSEGGIPDILMIRDGHYFGFEVKRPVVGIRSKLQEQTASDPGRGRNCSVRLLARTGTPGGGKL